MIFELYSRIISYKSIVLHDSVGHCVTLSHTGTPLPALIFFAQTPCRFAVSDQFQARFPARLGTAGVHGLGERHFGDPLTLHFQCVGPASGCADACFWLLLAFPQSGA